MEIDLNRGKGVFTDFIKQFVGEEKFMSMDTLHIGKRGLLVKICPII